jgi:hypothetical protein
MKTLIVALTLGSLAISARAQAPSNSPTVPIRQLAKLDHTSVDALGSAATAFQLPDGGVIVNDIRARRLVLFDSTLAHTTILADTTSATSNAYGHFGGTLIRYRGDSLLFVDVASLSMLVVDPNGKLGRVIAIPRPDDAQLLLGNVFGIPGFDAHGRLIYHATAGFEGTFVLCCVEHPGRMGDGSQRYRAVPKPDSALLVRVDLASRIADTLTSVKIEWEKQRIALDDQGYVKAIERIAMPNPMVDAWVVLFDGSLAVVRGRDYHIDWLGADGKWNTTPKIPFAWKRIDDARKAAIIDSSALVEQAVAERMNVGRGGGGVGGRRGGGVGSGRSETPIPAVIARADVADIPDYARPFTEGAAIADLSNNLWIRTTTQVDSRPVYDIVNRRGALIDRVQLPAFRSIAGFGPGVVYLAVQDAGGQVHLERARVH